MERPKIDFLYLNEEDMIKAGVDNLEHCVEVMDEMFRLMGEGDYVMGGANHNSHGMKIFFPETTPFPNMPIKGPDRRFMALVGYLGGRFNVCGQKWYGSNIANKNKGLPRSILTAMLNDPDTGAPLAMMSANILSAVRTGAVPGVAAKYMAKKDSKVLGIIGCGVIGKSCMRAILETCKSVEEVKIYDLYKDFAEQVCQEIMKMYPVKARATDTLEEAVQGSDILNFATAGGDSPELKEEWVKPGVLILLPGSIETTTEFFTKQTIVVDNWKMYEAYKEEQQSLPGGYAKNNSGICGYLMEYVFEGKLPLERVIDLGDVVAGKHKGRSSNEENIIFVTDGMCTEDLAWGYEVYQNALKQGIGVKLNLF